MSTWPSAQDYTAAVSNPKLNFVDADIILSQPELSNLGIPRPRSGTYAIVYHLQGTKADYALRCFLRDFADQQERYAAISQSLHRANMPFTVTFDFLQKGIKVKGSWYPVLKMAWVKGEQLNRYIENNLSSPKKLLSLASQVKNVIETLQHHQIAHCDLQNGNILVSNDQLFLIDYDGMFVPQLAGRGSHEQGHPNFQHPLRSGHNFGPNIDNFSAWVIYFSLIALSLDPTLWSASGAKDNPDQLLFKRKDFDQPNNSNTLRLLTNHSNCTIQGLGLLFHNMLFSDVEMVPSLDQDPTGGQTNIIIPPKASPAWLQGHTKQTSAATPNSSNQVSNAPASTSVTASSWIIDSLTANQNVIPRFFAGPLIIPRITVYSSATAIVIALMVVFCVPLYSSFLFPVLAGASMLMAVNLMVLTIAYEKDPAMQEARAIKAEINQQNQEFAPIEKMVVDADKQKADLNKQYTKTLDGLKQQQANLRSAEQKEIDKINTQLQTILTDISNRRQQLINTENRELAALQTSGTGSRITQINMALQALSSNESRELSSALSSIQILHVQTYMQSQHLKPGAIFGVGVQLSANLNHFGYRTAADINSGIYNVPGIGPSKGADVENWRSYHESHARQYMPTSLPAATHNQIKSKYALEKTTLESERARLQLALRADEGAVRDKYQQQRTKLNEEQNVAQIAATNQIKPIHPRYSQDYANLDKQIAEQPQLLAKKLADIDNGIRDAQKQLFAAKLRIAKTKQKFEAYRKLTFKNYIRTLIFNKAA